MITQLKSELNNNQQVLQKLREILQCIPEVREGKMFGYPGFYVKGKLFACVYDNGIAIKLPENIANVLLFEPHVVPFQPLGKPRMKEWILLKRVALEDYQQDMALFGSSIELVSQLPTKTGRKNDKR